MERSEKPIASKRQIAPMMGRLRNFQNSGRKRTRPGRSNPSLHLGLQAAHWLMFEGKSRVFCSDKVADYAGTEFFEGRATSTFNCARERTGRLIAEVEG